MKLVIFGLSVSSSWGNGHATIWRGLITALARLGHRIVFFEHDTPYYAAHRDLFDIPGGSLILYPEWDQVAVTARSHLVDADVAIITSYCPDAVIAAEAVLCSTALRVFYDLDTPVTIKAIQQGSQPAYIGPNGLSDFDLVLSYTGGPALEALRHHLGARNVTPLYGCVNPAQHRPTPSVEHYRSALSYLGTHSPDRFETLAQLFLAPASQLPEKTFLLGGALYPESFPWQKNIRFVRHVPPAEHPAFYCSSRITLNVTRGAMRAMGYCPSGRLFEAAACGTPILSDWWEGMDEFFAPGSEILVASTSEEAIDAISLSDSELMALSRAARDRVLETHTAGCRVKTLLDILERARPSEANYVH